MFISRWIFTVKWGRSADLRALLKAEQELLGFSRMSGCIIGLRDRVMLEFEVESLAQIEDNAAEIRKQPGFKPLLTKLSELVEPGTIREVWAE